MEKNRTLVFLIALIVIVLLFRYSGFLGSFFAPEDIGMIQYAGGFDSQDIWHTNQIGSMTAVLGEYKIEVQKDSFRNEPIYLGNEPIYECEENTCGGVPDHIEDGCQIWKGTRDANCRAVWSLSSRGFYGGYGYLGTTGFCTYTSEYPFKSHCTRQTRLASKPEWGGAKQCWQGTYKVEAMCGGAKPTNIISHCCDYSTCWGKFKVYKNDLLIKETPWIRNSYSVRTNFTGETDLIADLFYGSIMRYNDCLRIENSFVYKVPKDAFSFDIIVPEEEILEGTENYALIEVTNNWKKVKGNLSVVYTIPYKILGFTREVIEIDSKIVEIPKGKTFFKYLIPTDMAYEKIYITPTFYVLMDGSEFSGVNGICFGQEDNTVKPLSSCDYILLGTFYGDKFNATTFSRKEFIPVEIQTVTSPFTVYPGQSKIFETEHIDLTNLPQTLKATFLIKAVAGEQNQTKDEVIIFRR